MESTYDSLLGELREADASDAINYTVNGAPPDDDGNFTITAEGIGAAEADHRHDIAAVENLQNSLNGKSNIGHTHELVAGVTVNGETVSGALTLEAADNMQISIAGQVVTLTPEPFAADAAVTVTDANTTNTEPLQIFSGTRVEWDAFTKTSGIRYVVFLHE